MFILIETSFVWYTNEVFICLNIRVIIRTREVRRVKKQDENKKRLPKEERIWLIIR